MKMKNALILMLALMMVVGTSAMVFAQPQLVNTVITADAITVAPGTVVNLTANTNTTGNHYFNDDKWTTTGGTLSDIIAASGSNTNSFVSTAKLSSNVEGAYTVSYWIEVRTGLSESSTTRDDEDDILITFVEVQQPVIFEVSAAPAIANKLIREHMPKLSRQDVNFLIREVAHEMGSHPEDENGSWFQGIDKAIVVDNVEVANPAYEAAVKAFMMELVNHPTL